MNIIGCRDRNAEVCSKKAIIYVENLHHNAKEAHTEGYLAAIMEAASDAVIVTDEKSGGDGTVRV